MNLNSSIYEKYTEFIEQCKNKNYIDISCQKHHIIPKFMGGDNTEKNLIVLSVEDHFYAHVILAECFSKKSREYKGNIISARHIKNWMEDLILIDRKLNGYSHSKETKLKLSKARKGKCMGPDHPSWGVSRSEEIKKKISLKNSGRKHTECEKTKMSEKTRGRNHPNFGKELSEFTRMKISSSLKGRKRPNFKFNRQKEEKIKDTTNGMYGKTHTDIVKHQQSVRIREWISRNGSANCKPVIDSRTQIEYKSRKHTMHMLNIGGDKFNRMKKAGILIYVKQTQGHKCQIIS